MPVFTSKKLDALKAALRDRFLMAANRTSLTLSGEEIIAAYMEKAHARMANDLINIVGALPTGHYFATKFVGPESTLKGNIVFNGTLPIPIPLYAASGMIEDAPEEIRIKVRDWVDYRTRQGAAFGDVLDGLDYLNDQCTTPRGFAMYLPALPGLMTTQIDNTPSGKAAGKAVEVMRNPKANSGDLPKMSRTARQRLHDASATVNAAALLRDTPRIDLQFGHGRLECHGMWNPKLRNHFMANEAEAHAFTSATFM